MLFELVIAAIMTVFGASEARDHRPSLAWPIEPATEAERDLINQAVSSCGKAMGRGDEFSMLALLRMEDASGIVPKNRRGLLLAVWCIESSFGTTDLVGDNGRAIGPMQIHPENAAYCVGRRDSWNATSAWALKNTPRDDLAFSGRCWLERINALLPKATALCPRSAFDVAEAMLSSNGYRWGCWAQSSHVKMASTWHRPTGSRRMRQRR